MYTKEKHIHFVGIGGIGMSGIAKILSERGYIISGCDPQCTQKSILDLQKIGCLIEVGNNGSLCHDQTIDTVVYSSDVPTSHPELVRARTRGITTITRGVMLAELTRTAYTIAVAGSHGKTTTTSLLSHIFITAKQDPTIVIGGYLHSIESNARNGNGQFLITETDESDRSLLHLFPTLSILTNIDREHLGTYKNLHDVTETFRQFLQKTPFYGNAIVCIDDAQIRSLLPLESVSTTTYGSSPDADWSFNNLSLESDHSCYQLLHKNLPLGLITLSIPGIHNVLNSLAACAAAYKAGISLEIIAHALQTFTGVDRRFTLKGTFQGAEIFDDYGHHPTEIQCTVAVARKRVKNKLILVFQPHRYSRTKTLWNDFVQLLATVQADHIIVTDIYASSENPVDDITGHNLYSDALKLNPHAPVFYISYDSDFTLLQQHLASLVCEGDLILLQGAGNINKLASKLLTSLK